MDVEHVCIYTAAAKQRGNCYIDLLSFNLYALFPDWKEK